MKNKIIQFIKFEWFYDYIVKSVEEKHKDKDIEQLKKLKYKKYAWYSTLLWMLIVIGLSFLFNCSIQCVFLIISFGSTRMFSGGYHENGTFGHFKCLSNMIIFCISFGLISKLTTDYYIIISIIAFLLILNRMFLMPKASVNTREFLDEDIFIFKKVYCFIISGLYLIVAIMCFLSFKYDFWILKTIVNSLSFGVIFSWFLLTDFCENLLKVSWKWLNKYDDIQIEQ